jgi:adenosylmethionine-8-amino-7-oxononanoate aminotransferase
VRERRLRPQRAGRRGRCPDAHAPLLSAHRDQRTGREARAARRRPLGGDNHVYFVASGSEANEAGFKFARQYTKHENPGQYRYKTISRYLGYHGTTLATLAAGGMGDRKMKFEPLGGNDFVHVAPPYCYRCPFGLTYPSCELACVKNIEATIQGEGPDTVSTVLVEPIMSAVGVAVPPDDYLPEVAAIAKKYGCLLHIDEVINGFGRTGKMFAHQHSGVRPDIVAIAKGIVSAYLPIAATVVRNDVFKSFVGEAADNRQVFQISTYGGHPVAAAVADRNVQIILESGWSSAPPRTRLISSTASVPC